MAQSGSSCETRRPLEAAGARTVAARCMKSVQIGSA